MTEPERVRVHDLFGETRNATIVFSRESKRGRTWYWLGQFAPVIRDRSGTPMPEWAGWWERHEFDLLSPERPIP